MGEAELKGGTMGDPDGWQGASMQSSAIDAVINWKGN